MNHVWTPEMETRFRVQIERETEGACRVVALLSFTLFPAFSVIDWFTHHDHIRILNEIRYTAVASFVAIYLIVRKKKNWNPYGWGIALLSIAAFSITCMTLVLDGYRSPYYAGVNLVILGSGLLFPWGAKQMGLLVSWFCLLYFVPVLIQAHFQIDDLPAFVNNAAFVISSAGIATISAFFSYRLRRESFAQFVEAEDARKRAEASNLAKDEATEALEMRDEFISVASHELKTPITVLKLQNELLWRFLERVTLPPDALQAFRKNLSRSNGQLTSLIRLIDDMLDLSRITSGKMDFSLGFFDVREVILEVTERLQDNLDERNITLMLDLQKDVLARLDRVRIEQVLTNLVTNAIKYAPGTPLKITLRVDGIQVHITVDDEGPGIPLELQPKVFERFQRGNTSHKIGGLGLGLYIAQQIMHGLQGKISLERKSGMGACFRIEFPLMAHADSSL